MSGRLHFALGAVVDRWLEDNRRILEDTVRQFRRRHRRIRAFYIVVPDSLWLSIFSASWYHKWYFKTLALLILHDLLHLRRQRRWRASLALSFTSLQAETKETSNTTE